MTWKSIQVWSNQTKIEKLINEHNVGDSRREQEKKIWILKVYISNVQGSSRNKEVDKGT